MFPCCCCNICNGVQVTPVDHQYSSPNVHKFIKLKNNRIIHVLHMKQELSATVTQPIRLEHSDTNLKRNSDKETSLVAYKNFNELICSSNFKQDSLIQGLNVQNGNKTLGYSVIYKNLINYQEPFVKYEEKLMFLIHGVGGCSKIWHNQIEFFHSKGYEIVAIDLLGHGQSIVLNEAYNYQFLEMALDCLFIYDMFAKCNGENIVIGHSYGCTFGTYLAQSRQNITKLILISGGSPHPLEYNSHLLKAPICLIQMIKPFLNCKFFCSAFSSYCSLPKYSDDAFKINSKVLLYTMKGQNWKLGNVSFHSQIKQKVLLIEGENDAFVPIDDALDMIKILKNAYLVVLSKGSHMIIMEDHVTLNNLIYLFINENVS